MPQPMRFDPVFKTAIWGGRDLERFGKKLPPGKVSESWELAALPEGASRVAEGPDAGLTLAEAVAKHRFALLGSRFGEDDVATFPLLVKILDANDWLSVQVHPDDAFAQSRENCRYGKNEMWYVLSAEPGARLIYGVANGISPEAFEAGVRAGRTGQMLRYVDVAPGDVFNIPAGLVHAIGAGLVLIEVQQSSNLVCRLWDFDRTDAQGRPRELHVDKALACAKPLLRPPCWPASCRGLAIDSFASCSGHATCKDTTDRVVRTFYSACRYFCVEKVVLDGTLRGDSRGEMFTAWTVAAGSAEFANAEGSAKASLGDTVLVPAEPAAYAVRGEATLIKAYVPDLEKDVFAPLMAAGYSKEDIEGTILFPD
jgi:mannose-6-phosphate isomerase